MTNDKIVTMSRELADLIEIVMSNNLREGTPILKELRALLAAPAVERQEPVKIGIDRPWKDYPLGTKAVAIGGGHWIKNINGWKWFCGSTFPTPGADATWVILPKPEQPAPVSVALPDDWQDQLFAEMERRFDLRKHVDDDHMVNDDTQIGVEFARDWICARLDKVKELKP